MRVIVKAEPHPGQKMVHDDPARFKVLAAGRRWGKTRLGVFSCLEVAAKGGRAWWVAPSYKVGEVGWRPLRRMGAKMGAEIRKVDRTVNLPGRGSVAVRSADKPDSLRGEGLDFVVMDEAAYTAEEAWIEALRPALADRQGGAMFISTPSGRNWFWRLHQRGLDGGEWQSWQLPTSTNPYIDPAEIEAARNGTPELTFEQEYLAVFLESEGAVFRNITACMGAPHSTPEEHDGHSLVAGIDWGKQADFTAISVGCRDCRQEVLLDRFNKIDYAFQRDRLSAAVRRWRVSDVLAETNAMGEPNLEMLQREGLPVRGFATTSTSKIPLIENLALTLERAEFQFLPDPVGRGELEAYERKVSPVTGRSQYGAPTGMNDDTVIARALMVRSAVTFAALPELQPTQRSKWLEGETERTGSRWDF